ncbi:MAG: hypothetical protein RJA70_4370 [Pseudomonadota bacterium]|jgi:NAD(P)-dependent dehydrogenase (short-subunit alcohol dehydrogenase family)
MFRLDGKTALITGGTSGIGRATAELFVAQGARVIACGRHVSADNQAADPGRALEVSADVTRAADRASLKALVTQEFEGLDILFVNAGVADFPLFEEVDEARFDALMDVNFKAAFFTIQALLPTLRPGASVILTTSIANSVGLSRLSLYGASKAALSYLAKSLSAEFAPRQIRVNALSPGPTETPIHAKYGARLTPEAMQTMGQETMSRSLAGRLASAQEVAQAALYLASDASNLLRGHELVIDGGIGL